MFKFEDREVRDNNRLMRINFLCVTGTVISEQSFHASYVVILWVILGLQSNLITYRALGNTIVRH